MPSRPLEGNTVCYDSTLDFWLSRASGCRPRGQKRFPIAYHACQEAVDRGCGNHLGSNGCGWAVKFIEEQGLGGKASACRALGLARSGVYRLPNITVESRRVRKEIIELSGKHPRYGYRRITALLKRDGWAVNAKRVQRIRRQEGLKVSKRQNKMRRLGQSTALRQQANHPRRFLTELKFFRSFAAAFF